MHRTRTPRTGALRALLADLLQRTLRLLTPARAGAGGDGPINGLVIGAIADPDLDMHLMSVRGTVRLDSLRTLEAELRSFERGTILHLDVTDAEFPDPAAYAEFEALIESLEHRRVRIRIVGLRPPVTSPPTG